MLYILYSRIFSYIVLSLLRCMYILHYINDLCCCRVVNTFRLYFDILGGCIPAVLIVTILQSPYKHDHIYFIIIFWPFIFNNVFKMNYFVFKQISQRGRVVVFT